MGWRWIWIAWLAALSALALGQGAYGCTPPSGYPKKVRLSPQVVADVMTRAAAYVDVAVVESVTPDFELGTRNPEAWRWVVDMYEDHPTLEQAMARQREEWTDAGRFHFRIVEHLKADGPAMFDINGQTPPPFLGRGGDKPFAPSLSALKYFLGEEDLANFPPPGACAMPVFASVGETFLVFRDDKGFLLRTEVPYRFEGRPGSRLGPAAFPIAPTGSPWLKIVRAALARQAPA